MKLGFDHSGRQPMQASGYFLAESVRKYGPSTGWREVRRIPRPELLYGDPDLVAAYVHAADFRRGYCLAMLSFSAGDIDVAAFNCGNRHVRRQVKTVVRKFENAAFAGIPSRHRPPILWVAHTHLGRLELHNLIPKAITATDHGFASFNPDPPRKASRNFWLAFQRHINAEFGWSEPAAYHRPKETAFEDLIEQRKAENHRIFGQRRLTRPTSLHPRFQRPEQKLSLSDYPSPINLKENNGAPDIFGSQIVDASGKHCEVARQSFQNAGHAVCAAIAEFNAAYRGFTERLRHLDGEIRRCLWVIDYWSNQTALGQQPTDDPSLDFDNDEFARAFQTEDFATDSPLDWEEPGADLDEDAPSSNFPDFSM